MKQKKEGFELNSDPLGKMSSVCPSVRLSASSNHEGEGGRAGLRENLNVRRSRRVGSIWI